MFAGLRWSTPSHLLDLAPVHRVLLVRLRLRMARAVGCMSRQSSGAVKQTQALFVGSFEKTRRFESANQLPGWSVWVASTGIRPRSRGKPSASSAQISALHSVVIRIRGLALNSAKTDSKNSAMCRSLRTVDRKLSWFCSRRASLSREIQANPYRGGGHRIIAEDEY